MDRVVEPVPVRLVGVVGQWIAKRLLRLVSGGFQESVRAQSCGYDVLAAVVLVLAQGHGQLSREPFWFGISGVERRERRPADVICVGTVEVIEGCQACGGDVAEVQSHRGRQRGSRTQEMPKPILQQQTQGPASERPVVPTADSCCDVTGRRSQPASRQRTCCSSARLRVSVNHMVLKLEEIHRVFPLLGVPPLITFSDGSG
ncbi:hypothetical protein Are01nite_72100 [Actinoplanes regularis]|nr:hypothetical protein Are01nite_72100 [Actinoplanes regularis]